MLKNIQSILEKEKFQCSIIPATDENPLDRLILFLGLDEKKREQILEIIAQEQVFKIEKDSKKSKQEDYFRIQFHYAFPFTVEDMSLGQVGNLILFLNQMSDFPGLELNELENKVSFRYVWLVKKIGVDESLILSLIGIIKLTLELFTASIERLASGEATFNELLKEVIEIANYTGKPPKK